MTREKKDSQATIDYEVEDKQRERNLHLDDKHLASSWRQEITRHQGDSQIKEKEWNEN